MKFRQQMTMTTTNCEYLFYVVEFSKTKGSQRRFNLKWIVVQVIWEFDNCIDLGVWEVEEFENLRIQRVELIWEIGNSRI
jgi:hypothetical protein